MRKSARLYFRGPVWTVGAAVSAVTAAIGVIELIKGDSIWMWICFAAVALVAASFITFHRQRVKTAGSLASRIDDLQREGIALLDELSVRIEPEKKDGTWSLSFDAPPERWEKAEAFDQQIRELFIAEYPALLSDYRDRFNQFRRDKAADRTARRPEPENDSRPDAVKLREFADHMHSKPAQVVEASLEGLSAARHRVGNELEETRAMAAADMSEYERRAWVDVVKRRDRFLSRRARRLVPEPVRGRLAKAGQNAASRAQELPGAEQVERIVGSVVQGAAEGVSRAALATLSTDKVVQAFRDRNGTVDVLADVRDLDLRQVDQVRPRLDGKYMVASGGAGVGAGFVISGGEVMAVVGGARGAAAGAPAGGVGAAPGAGAGAGPSVATVTGAIGADAAATLFSAMRLVFETAAYYGYDPNRPDERLRAMGVLNVATARDQTTKAAAYLELNNLVKLLVRNATWKKLDDNAITTIVRGISLLLAERLTKRKLGTAIPFVGIAIGGSLNVLTMSRIGDAADVLYRERFLREKYNLPDEPEVEDVVIDSAAVDEDIPVVEIVEQELDAAAAMEEFSLQFDPAEIQPLAERFSYAEDSGPRAAGAAASRRGHYEAAEFVTVCNWKTSRSTPRVAANPPAAIESATHRALSDGVNERERMQSICELQGVGVPTASALLHFARPDSYPILDVRALESLGVKGRSTYSVAFWLRYLDACRSLAARHSVSVRTLDKALWQYSKERSVSA